MPHEISSNQYEPNKLLVKVWDASLFVRKRDGQRIEPYTTLSATLPKQISSGMAELIGESG